MTTSRAPSKGTAPLRSAFPSTGGGTARTLNTRPTRRPRRPLCSLRRVPQVCLLGHPCVCSPGFLQWHVLDRFASSSPLSRRGGTSTTGSAANALSPVPTSQESRDGERVQLCRRSTPWPDAHVRLTNSAFCLELGPPCDPFRAVFARRRRKRCGALSWCGQSYCRLVLVARAPTTFQGSWPFSRPSGTTFGRTQALSGTINGLAVRLGLEPSGEPPRVALGSLPGGVSA